MFKFPRYQFPRIVARLRIVFVTISLVLVTAAIVGFFQLRTLTKSVDQLAVSSVSVFVKTSEMQRNLKNFLLSLQLIDSVERLDDLTQLADSMEEPIAKLQASTSNLTEDGHSADDARTITAALEEIHSRASDILVAKEQMLEHAELLATVNANLRGSRARVQTILEEIAHDTIVSTERVFRTAPDAADTTLGEIEDHYHASLVLTNTITSITLEIEAIFDAILSLQNIRHPTALSKAETTLRFKMKGVVVLAGQLQDSPSRAALAGEVALIRNTLFGADGLMDEVESLQTQRNSLERNILLQHAPIESISTLSNQLTNAARNQIELARQNVTLKARQISAAVTLATALALCAMAGTMFFIVERQINRRMASLTKAVLSIAAGQTDYEVDVTGPDELGEMAEALETFKLNAHELQRSNIELEKFAYVAAHDLRSPLRAIQDLAEWTVEDPDTVLSEESVENMGLLQNRTHRLNQLLSDLLEYSRVGKEENDLAHVSIGEIVAEVASILDQNGTFQISYSGHSAPVVTYATPLRQILLNLISNSMKHHDMPKGEINIHAQLKNDRIVVSVQDDGAGIAPPYHDKIFGLFQTLKSRDEVEGSGLGLAIIRKLIEHYNGSITVQSDPEHGRGCVFVFDLPEKSTEMWQVTQAA